MKNCVFCEIKKKGIFDAESKYFFVIFDRFPVSPGHALIIPKRHVESFLDLNKNEREEFWKVLRKTIKLIETTNLKELYKKIIENAPNKKSVAFCKKILLHPKIGKKPDGYNIGINEGRAAGRTIDHLHIHVIPRYFGDVKDPTGGVRNVISKLGNYKR